MVTITIGRDALRYQFIRIMLKADVNHGNGLAGFNLPLILHLKEQIL